MNFFIVMDIHSSDPTNQNFNNINSYLFRIIPLLDTSCAPQFCYRDFSGIKSNYVHYLVSFFRL